jgi:hypothetical protein
MARYQVTWGCNGEPPQGSVECDTRENAEALRARLPYPVVGVIRLDPPQDDGPYVRTWDSEMHRPMRDTIEADRLSRSTLSPFVRRALSGTMPASAHGARAFVR